jgi:hypothetical protein
VRGENSDNRQGERIRAGLQMEGGEEESLLTGVAFSGDAGGVKEELSRGVMLEASALWVGVGHAASPCAPS